MNNRLPAIFDNSLNNIGQLIDLSVSDNVENAAAWIEKIEPADHLALALLSAQNNYLSILKVMSPEFLILHQDQVKSIAIIQKQLDILKWGETIGYQYHKIDLLNAVSSGQKHVVNWLISEHDILYELNDLAHNPLIGVMGMAHRFESEADITQESESDYIESNICLIKKLIERMIHASSTDGLLSTLIYIDNTYPFVVNTNIKNAIHAMYLEILRGCTDLGAEKFPHYELMIRAFYLLAPEKALRWDLSVLKLEQEKLDDDAFFNRPLFADLRKLIGPSCSLTDRIYIAVQIMTWVWSKHRVNNFDVQLLIFEYFFSYLLTDQLEIIEDNSPLDKGLNDTHKPEEKSAIQLYVMFYCSSLLSSSKDAQKNLSLIHRLLSPLQFSYMSELTWSKHNLDLIQAYLLYLDLGKTLPVTLINKMIASILPTAVEAVPEKIIEPAMPIVPQAMLVDYVDDMQSLYESADLNGTANPDPVYDWMHGMQPQNLLKLAFYVVERSYLNILDKIDAAVISEHSVNLAERAAIHGHVEVLDYLFNQKFKIKQDKKEKPGVASYVILAAKYGQISILNWAEKKHNLVAMCKRHSKHRDEIIYEAISCNQINVLEWLKEKDIKLRLKNNSKLELVDEAVICGHMDVLIWLKKNGFSLNSTFTMAPYDFQWNLSLLAGCYGHMDLLKWLITEEKIPLYIDDLWVLSPIYALQADIELTPRTPEELRQYMLEIQYIHGENSDLLMACINKVVNKILNDPYAGSSYRPVEALKKYDGIMLPNKAGHLMPVLDLMYAYYLLNHPKFVMLDSFVEMRKDFDKLFSSCADQSSLSFSTWDQCYVNFLRLYILCMKPEFNDNFRFAIVENSPLIFPHLSNSKKRKEPLALDLQTEQDIFVEQGKQQQQKKHKFTLFSSSNDENHLTKMPEKNGFGH